MDVVVVPSLPKQSHLYTEATEVINSLLDLRPENWGLPPFEDLIDGTLPSEPWHIGGPVIKGYGRGKVLGIPTDGGNKRSDGLHNVGHMYQILQKGFVCRIGSAGLGNEAFVFQGDF